MRGQIWKFALVLREQVVSMPEGAEIVSAGSQDGTLVVWAICNPARPRVQRKIAVVGTGWPVPETGVFIGTVQMTTGLVWHVFDLA